MRNFLKAGGDWERISVKGSPGVFVVKAPAQRGRPASLMVEINPVGADGAPTKRRGLIRTLSNETIDGWEMAKNLKPLTRLLIGKGMTTYFIKKLDFEAHIVIASIIGLLFFPLVTYMSPSWVWLLLFANYYTVLSTSWNLVVGYTGQFSFGHHGLLAVGGYVSAIIVNEHKLHPIIGLILGGAASTLAGLLIGIASLRLKGIYFALTTFGFSYIIYLFIINEYRVTGGGSGLKTDFLFYDSPYLAIGTYYYVSLVLMSLAMLTTYIIIKSRYGLFLMAIREDEEAAAIYGINVVKMKILVFLYSSFLAGLMGAFYTHVIGYISPAIADLSVMGTIIIISVLGGLGTFGGPLTGSYFIWPLSEIIRSYSAYLNQVIFTVAIILTLKFMRNGIWGYIKNLLEKRYLS